MNTNEPSEPIYPCEFPLKVIGDSCADLQAIIVEIMASQGESIHPEQMSCRQSAKGTYLSISFQIVAKSREHIEGIFTALNAHESVRIVL